MKPTRPALAVAALAALVWLPAPASATGDTTTTSSAPTTTTTGPPNTLPVCPPVIYDGVLPQDGGTGPQWPEGPPLDDCQGSTPPAELGPATVLERAPQPARTVELAPTFTG